MLEYIIVLRIVQTLQIYIIIACVHQESIKYNTIYTKKHIEYHKIPDPLNLEQKFYSQFLCHIVYYFQWNDFCKFCEQNHNTTAFNILRSKYRIAATGWLLWKFHLTNILDYYMA